LSPGTRISPTSLRGRAMTVGSEVNLSSTNMPCLAPDTASSCSRERGGHRWLGHLATGGCHYAFQRLHQVGEVGGSERLRTVRPCLVRVRMDFNHDSVGAH